jgi:hypothetical protein
MPYIKQEDRDRLYYVINRNEEIRTPGELNYLITRLCLKYREDKGVMDYETLNSIVGVLECAKQEFYRRMVSPYEDKKIRENGDVY